MFSINPGCGHYLFDTRQQRTQSAGLQSFGEQVHVDAEKVKILIKDTKIMKVMKIMKVVWHKTKEM